MVIKFLILLESNAFIFNLIICAFGVCLESLSHPKVKGIFQNVPSYKSHFNF